MATRALHSEAMSGDPHRCFCWTNDPRIPYYHHRSSHDLLPLPAESAGADSPSVTTTKENDQS
jgi:hypothetical protein